MDPSSSPDSNSDLAASRKNGGESSSSEEKKFGIVWSDDDYERLRLCRNRAYHKVNKKRRMHLPASLSSFLLREWQQEKPAAQKITAKNLLTVYTERFEAPAVVTTTGSMVGRKRSRNNTPDRGANDDEHTDKAWSDEMLDNLLQCGDRADERQKTSGGASSSSEFLLEEWRKLYPKSTLTGRNLRSRLTVFLKTRSEAPPPSKRKRFEAWSKSLPPSPLAEVPDEFAPAEEDVVEAAEQPAVAMAEEIEPEKEKPSTSSSPSCEHWMHLFTDGANEGENCLLTSQLLGVRDEAVPQFPGCDIYHVKKPKGFTAVILRGWKRIYPATDESIKSTSVKFFKYDSHPARRGEPSRADVHGVVWTEELLNDLTRTKRIARERSGKGASSIVLNRHWKREWIELYPHINVDWKIICSKYDKIQGDSGDDLPLESSALPAVANDVMESDFSPPQSASSSLSGIDDRLQPSLDDSMDDKVKGFRNWTSKTREDLLETKLKIVAANPTLEPGSSAFNRLLLQEFQRLHPKCMESARSIYAKVQSIEKEVGKASNGANGSNGKHDSDEDSDPAADGEDEIVSEREVEEVERVVVVKEEEINGDLSDVEGFEDWTYTMIRDFITCMDVARRKYAELKENDPGCNVKLVPLLLEMWKEDHKNSKETVKSILGKIKHLRMNKNMIKERCGLLPKTAEDGSTGYSPVKKEPKKKAERHISNGEAASSNDNSSNPNGPFKWHRSMMDDVIVSRKRALEIKEQGSIDGKKLSFHLLWAEEFRKLHPASTFTSNNLSVHFWTWRKAQQRLGRADPLYDADLHLADTSRPLQQHAQAGKGGQGTTLGGLGHWTAKAKRDLLQLGRHVESTLANPNTPNELKLKGFAGLLQLEWTKRPATARQAETASARALSAMYAKVLKQGIHFKEDEVTVGGKTAWTPKHQTAIRRFTEVHSSRQLPFSTFSQNVMEDFRRKFPKSSAKNSVLLQRIKDLLANESFQPSVIKKEEPATPTKTSRSVSRSNSGDLPEPMHLQQQQQQQQPNSSTTSAVIVRKPNARGQMCWNKQTIVDLFNCHARGLRRRKRSLHAMAKKEAPMLSHLVHEEFLKLHQYCKLTPAILMAKCYCWKNAMNKGTLKIDVKLETEEDDEEDVHMAAAATAQEKVLENNVIKVETTAVKTEKLEAAANDRNRIWSKKLLKDSVLARRIAIRKKTKAAVKGKKDEQGLLDTWREEFSKLHPEVYVTKKALASKFLWLRQIKKLGGSIDVQLQPVDIDEEEEKPKPLLHIVQVKKDLHQYIKEVMEKNRIYLPKKLPLEAELKLQEEEEMSAAAINLRHQQQVQVPFSLPNFILPNQPQSIQQQQQSLQQLAAPQVSLPNRPAVSLMPPRPPTAHLSSSAKSAAETLASFHQQAVHHTPPSRDVVTITEVPPNRFPPPPPAHQDSMPLNLSLPSHIKNQTTMELVTPPAQLSEAEKKDAIKLPGGATLVAVTDRNADTLLKPKPMEKPHVTITIGDKGNNPSSGVTPPPMVVTPPSISLPTTPVKQPIVLPINVPKFTAPSAHLPRVPGTATLSPMPDLPQLRPFGMDMTKNPPQIALLPLQHQFQQPQHREMQPPLQKAIYIPIKVKALMDQTALGDKQFFALLDVYEAARTEFFDVVQRGFLAYFPYVLGCHWRKSNMSYAPYLPGKALNAVVETYIEEKNRGFTNDQEYLTKRPCNFEVTEQLLHQILVAHAEVREAVAKRQDDTAETNPGIVYHRMCKRWGIKHPNFKITTKQLISIHEMLVFDPESGKGDSSPEAACAMADIWKLLEREVPTSPISVDKEEQDMIWLGSEDDDIEISDDEDNTDFDYDEETVSMEQLQEWVSDSQNLGVSRRIQDQRPRLASKNIRLFWTKESLADLEKCRRVAISRSKLIRKTRPFSSSARRLPLARHLFRAWRQLHPDCKLNLSQVISKSVRQTRFEKREQAKADEKEVARCRRLCEDFFRNEDLNEVIDEEAKMRDLGGDDADAEMMDADDGDDENILDPKLRAHSFSLSRIRCVALLSNLRRNFHRTDDVIDYIREMQRLSGGGSRGHPQITWTPDVIDDLVRAREIARGRKNNWEDWARRKFGGVGAAYSRKDSKFVKVDDMFHEEWCKIRPDMAHLSVWTLVAYARKFDGLQKELIEFNRNQKEAAPKAASVPPGKATIYFPDSGLPRFDLAALQRLPGVEQEVKDLLRTRQLAKERQLTPGCRHLRLAALWEEEWRRLHPHSQLNGNHLLRTLYRFETHPENVTALKFALARSQDPDKPRQNFQADERPAGPLPRFRVFREDEDSDKPLPFNLMLSHTRPVSDPQRRDATNELLFNMQRDIFVESVQRIDVPCIELERVTAVLSDGHEDVDDDLEDEELMTRPGTRFSDGSKWEKKWKQYLEKAAVPGKAKYVCSLCPPPTIREFHNVNNLRMHFAQHEKPIKLLEHRRENLGKRWLWSAKNERRTKREEEASEEEEEELPTVKKEDEEDEIELVCKEEILAPSPTPVIKEETVVLMETNGIISN